MERFDYNPIEKSDVHHGFIDYIEYKTSNGKARSSVVSRGISDILAKELLSITQDSSQTRAQQLITDAQASSQLSEKAKEAFVYETQVAKKANKSYVFVPAVTAFRYFQLADSISRKEVLFQDYRNGYRVFRAEGEYTIFFYKVKNSNGTITVSRIGHESSTFSFNTVTNRDKASSTLYKKFINSIPSDLNGSSIQQRIASYEEFVLTEQIISKYDNSIEFELGEKEGIRVDDKFYHIQIVEEDGVEKEIENGWSLVKVQGKKKDTPYKSSAQIIAGDPEVGDVVKEISIIGGAVALGYSNKPLSIQSVTTDSTIYGLETSSSGNFDLNLAFNVGRHAGISQLYFFLDFQFGGGSATGTSQLDSNYITDIDGYISSSFQLGILKKLYFSRFAVVPSASLYFNSFDLYAGSIDMPFNSGDTYLFWYASGFGAVCEVSIEYALSPHTNIGIGANYRAVASGNSLSLWASSESTSPTWDSFSSFFGSSEEGDEPTGGNDRIEDMPVSEADVEMSQSGIGVRAYIIFEF